MLWDLAMSEGTLRIVESGVVKNAVVFSARPLITPDRAVQSVQLCFPVTTFEIGLA